MSVTQDIKSRLDLVDIVSETVQLRKSGRSYAGFCPFHDNTRTPSFYVFPETQTWRCFGACAEGGDLFSFVMKRENWEFKETLVHLAQRAGVELEPNQPRDQKQKAREDRMADLLAAAADYFHQLFLHAPQAEMARRYVQGRQLTEATQAAFQLGFALDAWDACRTHFTAQGFTDQELVDVGLLTENEERGRRYDRFRNRLMIPIRDHDGRTVGFGARTLDKDGLPKYLNSPQSLLFDKSHLLFGLDLARRDIREARQVVIVEGYLDVMQVWQAGFRNVVAQMGTALTEQQLLLLKRYTKRFVLALDADAAGAKATMRSLQVARETLDREVEVQFDAHGLVQHEGRLQADIRVMTLPTGEDPDSIVRQEPARWPELVAAAQPVVAYVIAVMTQELDMHDAKAKTAVAQQVVPLIKDIQDPVERDHYWQELARALQIDERALRQVRLPEKRPYTPPPSATTPPVPEMPPMEGEARRPLLVAVRSAWEKRQMDYLRQCLHAAPLMRMVNQRLQQHGQTAVHAQEFHNIEDGAIANTIMQWANRSAVATIAELWDILDITLTTRLQQILVLPTAPDIGLERLADILVLSVLDWRLQACKQQLVELKHLFPKTTRQEEPELAEMYDRQIRELSISRLHLDKARNAMSATAKRRIEEALQQ